MAQSSLTPRALQDLMPVSFPLTHTMDEFPGVARYPVDAWEAADAPMMAATGWTKLCMRIAIKHMGHLGDIFELAKKADPVGAAEELEAMTGQQESSPCPSRASSSKRTSSSVTHAGP